MVEEWNGISATGFISPRETLNYQMCRVEVCRNALANSTPMVYVSKIVSIACELGAILLCVQQINNKSWYEIIKFNCVSIACRSRIAPGSDATIGVL